MKKIFTLFAAALVGVCAFAQMPETCPSELSLKLLDGSDPAKATVEVMVVNSSLNLNGFNTELGKLNANGEDYAAVAWKRAQGANWFTGKGYANVILARLVENPDFDWVTDADLEEMLSDMADIKSNKKVTEEGDRLVIIELLSTNDVRFFPVLEEPTAVGYFAVDMSALVDAKDAEPVTFAAPAIPSRYSFSYTGGVEGTRAWTPDAPIEYALTVEDGQVVEPTISAINTISTDKAVDNRIFDLQGRELQSVPEHGIYIQNGKKYVK